VKRPLAIALGLAVAVALAACEDEPPPPDPVEDPFVVQIGDTYVAIGDSFTAAPKTGPQVEDDGCSQTRVNYPHLIAKATDVDLIDNSCSGADTSHLTQAKRFTQRGPQLDDIDTGTDLVTFRLGANDGKLIGKIIICAYRAAAGKWEDETQPCTDADDALGDAAAEPQLAAMAANVERGLRQVRDRAPDARIIVPGYPQFVPPDGGCDVFPVPEGDQAWAEGIIDGLNTALRDAAESVDGTYIDVYSASVGHDACSDEPWVAGVRVPGGAKAIPFHPYPEESEAVADLVLAELRS